MSIASMLSRIIPSFSQPNTANGAKNQSWARVDATGSVFQISRSKYLSHSEMTKKINAANEWNNARLYEHRTTKSGKEITRCVPKPGSLTMSARNS